MVTSRDMDAHVLDNQDMGNREGMNSSVGVGFSLRIDSAAVMDSSVQSHPDIDITIAKPSQHKATDQESLSDIRSRLANAREKVANREIIFDKIGKARKVISWVNSAGKAVKSVSLICSCLVFSGLLVVRSIHRLALYQMLLTSCMM